MRSISRKEIWIRDWMTLQIYYQLLKTKQNKKSNSPTSGIQKNLYCWRRRDIIMRQYRCCDTFLFSLGRAVNCQFRTSNTNTQPQPVLPAVSLRRLLSSPFMELNSLQFCICGSSCPPSNSMLTETFRFFPLESTALLSWVPYM